MRAQGLFYISKEKQPLSGLDAVHLSSTTQPAEHFPTLMDTLPCAYKLTRPAKGEVSLNLHLRNKSIKPRSGSSFHRWVFYASFEVWAS